MSLKFAYLWYVGQMTIESVNTWLSSNPNLAQIYVKKLNFPKKRDKNVCFCLLFYNNV